MPANSIFSGPITLNFKSMHFDGDPFTCQCEKQKQKSLRVSNFALLWVVFKLRFGSEGVNIHRNYKAYQGWGEGWKGVWRWGGGGGR